MAQLEINNAPIYDKYRSTREATSDLTWCKQTFMLANSDDNIYNKWLKYNRFFSTADIKSSDTHVSNSIAINPDFQFTRYADIRRPGMLRVRNTNNTRITGVPSYDVTSTGSDYGLGFGTYYARAIDDNQQRIFMRFGEPQYTSMIIWAIKSFDIHKAVLFRRGLISRLLISVVHAGATLFSAVAAPMLFGARLILDLFVNPGKFVSVRDNMYTYWMMVDTLLNKFFVKRTKLPFKYAKFSKNMDTSIDRPIQLSASFVKGLSDLIPGVIDPDTGRISLFAIALSGQAAYNRMITENMDRDPSDDDNYGIANSMSDYRFTGDVDDGKLVGQYYNSSIGDPKKFTKKFLELAYEKVASDYAVYAGGNRDSAAGGWIRDIQELTQKITMYGDKSNGEEIALSEEEDMEYQVPMDSYSTAPDGEPLLLPVDGKELTETSEYVERMNRAAKENTFRRYAEYLTASMTGGSAFLILNVNSTGSVGESFSNSLKTNPIETAFNAVSSRIRAATEVSAGFLEIPVIGSAIKLATDTAMGFLSGATQGFANPLISLLYGTTISLPQQWESSSANLPSGNYSVKLTSPYGNSYSQLFSIYLPLACLMAASLPRAVGADSHMAPFMCQLFDVGRVNIPLGIVSDISITRGTSNLPFTRAGQPNAIDVEFTVTDLNKILTLELDSAGMATRAMHSFYPDLTNKGIDHYVDTVTGLDVYSQFYTIPNKRLMLIERELNIKALFTDQAAQAAMTVGNVPFLSSMKEIFHNNGSVLDQYR